MALLEVYLVKLGIVHAAQVLIVADGALWIWQRLPSLLQRLGLPKERVIELIDFYHATQHLLQFAEEAFANKSVQRQWFKRARSQLKHKPFSLLLAKMYEQVEQQQSKSKQKKLKAHLAYFSAQPQRFAYAQVRAMKLPIGSGAIESLIRQVVNLRLKGTGKFWLANHAEVVLHGRCQWAAGQWQQFSQSVLRAALDSKPLPILTPASPQLVPA